MALRQSVDNLEKLGSWLV